MSETQRTLFTQCVSGLLMAGALLLVAIYLARSTPPPPPEPVNERRSPPPDGVRQTPPEVFDAEVSFKRTIIDNNLFRPLGWTPPHPKEPYRLLGTMIPRDAKAPRQAILQATATNTTHIVTTGDKLDANTKVVDILQKHITLETNGQQRSISLNTQTWLR